MTSSERFTSRAVTTLRPVCAAALLVLAGCAVQPEAPYSGPGWEEHRAQAASITQWQLSGKVALRWDGGAETASLDWLQQEAASEIDLSGPFGAGAVRITHQDQVLTVRRGGETEVYDSSTPETLAAASGWPIPVDGLPFWLRGLPDPEQALDGLVLQDGRALEIRQGGWTISYTDYAPVAASSLPTAMELTHGRDAIRLRLVKGRWTVGGT